MRPTFFTLSAIAVGALSACGTDISENSPDAGPLSVSIGVVQGNSYVPFTNDAPCEIVDASQGGFWFMPALSVVGLDPTGDRADVQCTLFDIIKNRELASVSGEYRFYGYDYQVRTNLVMLLADLNSQNLHSYDGDRSTLACTVSKDGQEVEESLTVFIDVPGEHSTFARPALEALP